MPRLKPSDIGKSGRADFAGMSHLGLEETAWRLREAALAFVNCLGENSVRVRPTPTRPGRGNGGKNRSRPDGGCDEAAPSPQGAKPIVPGLAGERWPWRLPRSSRAATLPCASDPHGGRTGR